ncbi:MAG TPA: hypothetical protein ENN46_03500, partial [Candidatus Woesearchaeota archaeon]|nr:hypothetical protein [Candidatus Woesearchaeota archaeon]
MENTAMKKPKANTGKRTFGKRKPSLRLAWLLFSLFAFILIMASSAYSRYNISGSVQGFCFNNTLITGSMYNASSLLLLSTNTTNSNSSGGFFIGFPSSAGSVSIVLNATSALCPGARANKSFTLPASPGTPAYTTSRNITLNPSLALIEPEGIITNAPVNFTWQMNFSGTALFDLLIYGSSLVTQTGITAKSAIQALDDDFYNWSITATHSARSLSSENQSFLLDSTPPDCSSSSLALETLYTLSQVNLSWPECTDTIQVSNYTITAENLNTSATYSYTSESNSTSISLATDGFYNITVCANDLAQNQACFSSVTKLDMTPPAINQVTINPIPITEHTSAITLSVNSTDLFGIRNVFGRIRVPGSSFTAYSNFTLTAGLFTKEYSSLSLIGKGLKNITFDICSKDTHNHTTC